MWYLNYGRFSAHVENGIFTRFICIWGPSAARSPLYFTLGGLSALIFVQRLDPIELQHSTQQPISSHFTILNVWRENINKNKNNNITVLPDIKEQY